MGWSSSKTSGNGGGTIINPTNNRVSVKQNNSTFGDAQIISDITSLPIQLELLDSNNLTSLNWENRFLCAENGLSESLKFACSNQKTESKYYQNDFLARLESQARIIHNAVFGELWWSGHTIEVTNQPSPLVPIGAVLVCKNRTWQVADFLTLDSINLIGIYLGSNQVLLDGHIVVTETGVTSNFPIVNGQSTAEIGTPIYGNPLSLGNMTISPPNTTNDVLRRLGHAYFVDELVDGYFLMLFRPSNDWTLIS